MTRKLLAFAPFALTLLFSAAPAPALDPASGANILVAIEPADRAAFVDLLSRDLDEIRLGSRCEFLVTPEQRRELLAYGHEVQTLNPDMLQGLREIKRSRGDLGAYTTYSEMIARLNAMASAYPSLASHSVIGVPSHEGRDIHALKISDNVAVDENEPEVLYMATYHARELITVEIALALADSLLMNYGTDPRLTDWVNTREIWILPMVNPDGHVYVENVDSNWRKNRRNNGWGSFGVDLNRNHAWEWGADDIGSSSYSGSEVYRGPSAVSEPEIQTVQSFVDSRQFVFCLSFHSYSNLWLWGPAHVPGLSEDEDIFSEFGAQVNALNGYAPGNPASGTIYIANGEANDWMYNSPTHPKIFGFTPEVGGSSDGFYPPESRIPALIAENIEPAWLCLAYAERPGQLAPPGAPAITSPSSSGSGSFTLEWDAPTTADTQPVSYEVVEMTGPAASTDGLESGGGNFTGNWSPSSARAYAGSFSLYSGSGDAMNRISIASEDYLVQPGDALTFRGWYDIESNWDYAYVLLSTDGGRSFTNLPGTGTSASDPNGSNAGNGITGSSGGWQAMSFDLSSWAGQPVRLGFRYSTDAYVTEEGFYADDIHPVMEWGSATVVAAAAPGTTLPLTGVPDGTYHYKARGRDAEGDDGYWSAPWEVVVESATEVATAPATGRFHLTAATPNPFTRETGVSFGLREPGTHRLTVHNVAGRLVRTLSDGSLGAGTHHAVWDGRDDRGRTAPSGVYFYRLATGSGTLDGRVVLRR
ncbi:MAG: M14 family zinc carboxypeptidase [Gemmatimonadota bacterium]|jgi:hypothetical protein|nr:M14 family zinc carboxypeptidase [Gemmatimonadota bacterium]MDP6803463.1 M14 family zinc carboxypeptidase [Gemmatimonadota bacterium]MDP7032585.1 M14 family zinc carboxypeptidase [Gemmatimonadota bacterium]